MKLVNGSISSNYQYAKLYHITGSYQSSYAASYVTSYTASYSQSFSAGHKEDFENMGDTAIRVFGYGISLI